MLNNVIFTFGYFNGKMQWRLYIKNCNITKYSESKNKLINLLHSNNLHISLAEELDIIRLNKY